MYSSFKKLKAGEAESISKIPSSRVAAKKNLLIGAAMALAVLAPALVHAQSFFGITGWAAYAVGEFFYALNSIVAGIAGILIAVEAMTISLLLTLNRDVVNTFVVQAGSSVTLALANLGFVLGIIIVALATIMRNQSYGVKQVLWKLVVAAVLVNFSLPIAGAILGFADQLSQYFLSGFPGAGGGVVNFASNLATLFKPQSFLLPPNAGGSAPALVSQDVQGLAAATGATLGSSFAMIFSVAFVAIILVIMVVTLAGFVLMLLARYVILSILLVLMPLAWVCWVFPKIAGNWGRWWSTFIRWTFFAPVVLFFMWLVIGMGATVQGLVPVANVSASFGFGSGLIQGLLQPFLSAAVLIGLTWGGLFAANSMSIAGSKMAMGWAGSVRGAAQGYAWKKTQQGAARLVPEKIKQKLERGEYKVAPKRVQSWLGRGAADIQRAGRGAQVEKEAGWVREKMKDEEGALRLLASRGGLNDEQQMALLSGFNEKGRLHKVKEVDGKGLADFFDNEKRFERQQQAKFFKEGNQRIGSTPQARKAQKAILAEAAKNPDFAAASKNFKLYGEQIKKLEQENERATRLHTSNPNATITDATGAVTGAAGTQLNVQEFMKKAGQKYSEAIDKSSEAENAKNKIIREAEAVATVVDEKGALGQEGQPANANELANAEVEKMAKETEKADAGKILGNEIFGSGARLGLDEATADMLAERYANALGRHAPQIIGPMIHKMRSDPLEKIQIFYTRVLDILEKEAGTNQALKEAIAKRRRAFNNTIGYNLSSAGSEGFEEFGGVGTGGETTAGGGGGASTRSAAGPAAPTGSAGGGHQS